MENEIKSLTLMELQNLMADLHQPRFRAKQVYQWLHEHQAFSYDEMTNLPKSLRTQLQQQYPLSSVEVKEIAISKDSSRKYLLKFHDGAFVETVAIPSDYRNLTPHKLTVCFSTQIGCPMRCAFCATGKEGFGRNLTTNEIVEQVAFAQKDFQLRVSNVVAMGQGEPFLNFDNLIQALDIFNNPNGFNIGARHITVSTCGLVDGIKRFANVPKQYTLAVSLHSAIQNTRNIIMPALENQPLPLLKEALKLYQQKTNRRVTLEYVLLNEFNDDETHLRELINYCHGLICHVNLLPLNPIQDSVFLLSPISIGDHWFQELQEAGIPTTFRTSRGSDIFGACGQLKTGSTE